MCSDYLLCPLVLALNTALSCSLVCYKTHKPVHATENAPTEDSANTNDQSTTPTINTVASSASVAPLQLQPLVQARPNIQNILTSPAIASLLSSRPALLAQLRQIYTAMLPPSDPHSTYNSNNNTNNHSGYHPYHNRGRGDRGRGRGRGGQYRQNNDHKASWTQDRAEEQALKLVGKLRGAEDEEGRQLDEFVKVMKEVVGGFGVSDATAEVDDAAVAVL